MLHEALATAGDTIVYIGGYADFKGVSKPLTLVMSGGHYKGAVTASLLCFGLGAVVDFSALGDDSIRDRIAGVLYYGASVAVIAFFGLSKTIQDIAIGMNVKGQMIDGALIASIISGIAHLYLLSVIFAGASWLSKVRGYATQTFGIGLKRTGRLNTKIMFTFPVVALTVPLAAGPVGFLIGLIAKLTTYGSLNAASFTMGLFGAY